VHRTVLDHLRVGAVERWFQMNESVGLLAKDQFFAIPEGQIGLLPMRLTKPWQRQSDAKLTRNRHHMVDVRPGAKTIISAAFRLERK
jgi:hypothetical protein